MARTRSFDADTVIAASAALFVRTGYEGTSIDELVTATGLQRGSLYGAFGSKRGIFLAALGGDADAPGPVDERLDLLLVALLELAPRDAEIREICARRVAALPRGGAQLLGRRLLERAGIAPPKKGPTP